MDCSKTENYLKEKRRMCETVKYCEECPFYDIEEKDCFNYSSIKQISPKEAIAVVQNWSDEHPPRTYAQDFSKKLPNAEKDANGAPSVCRARCYGTERPDSCGETWYCCSDCWNEPMEVKND